MGISGCVNDRGVGSDGAVCLEVEIGLQRLGVGGGGEGQQKGRSRPEDVCFFQDY